MHMQVVEMVTEYFLFGTSESLLQVVVVFAGGGHATFYEGGFISPVPPMRLPRGCMRLPGL